jgi:hypothetical protein
MRRTAAPANLIYTRPRVRSHEGSDRHPPAPPLVRRLQVRPGLLGCVETAIRELGMASTTLLTIVCSLEVPGACVVPASLVRRVSLMGPSAHSVGRASPAVRRDRAHGCRSSGGWSCRPMARDRRWIKLHGMQTSQPTTTRVRRHEPTRAASDPSATNEATTYTEYVSGDLTQLARWENEGGAVPGSDLSR